MDGIINLIKPPGMTSHDVISYARKTLHMKRIGHSGTLDPSAAGVLPLFLGHATRMIEFYDSFPKSYRAEIIFGIKTDTYDITGTVISSIKNCDIDMVRIREILKMFKGNILQVPPMYSAIRHKGKKLYDLARKGEIVERPERPISIYSLDINQAAVFLDEEFPHLYFDVECSRGTYIRSLCYDIGEKLGCGAVMGALVRTSCGPFTINNAVTLEDIAEYDSVNWILSSDFMLDMPILTIQGCDAKSVACGKSLPNNGVCLPGTSIHVRVYCDEKLIAIYQEQMDNEKSCLVPCKVFIDTKEMPDECN